MNRLLLCLLMLASQSVVAADEAFAWQTPFELELPETARTIALAAGADAAAFMAENGLDNARILPLGRSGSILEVELDDEAWQAVSDRVCAGNDVASCATTVCQGIQLTGAATPGSQFSAEAVQARLVQNPPEMVAVPDEADGEAGSCQGPPLIPPLDSGGAVGSGPNPTIDLSIIDADFSSAPEPGAADATLAQDKRAFQFSLKSRFNPAGGVNLGTDDLPADTTDWTLVVGAGCTEVEVPLSSIEPARLPGIVVALVTAGDVAAVAGTYGLTVLRQLPLDSTGQNLVVFATAQDVFTTIINLAADARVDAAQPEFVYQTTAEAADAPVLSAPDPATLDPTTRDQTIRDQATPGYSDPFASLNYGPAKTRALELHPSAAGNGQLVAVIDTGVDVDHPDLQGRLRDPVDTTDKGFGPDVHGTAVVSIIAAEADNAVGSYGVAPAVEILPIKACHPKEEGGLSARCTTSSLVKALDVAIVADATIINMSLAGPPDDLLARFVSLAVQQDRLIVAGAGNGGEYAKPGFPAALPGVLAVTAIDVADKLYDQANRGDYIDVAAPGVDIISAAPNGQYPPLSGTSMAAAHVTGVAALISELGPLMGSREVGLIIKSNARDLGPAGIDQRFGAGLIDACRAASAATAEAVACATGVNDVEFDAL